MPNNSPSIRVNPNEMARLIEANLSAKSLSFAELPGGKMQAGNPAWFMSGIKRAGYNGITCAEFKTQALDAQIDKALTPFRETNTPLTWWVGPLSQPGNLGRLLQNHGFRHNRDMIGMAADLDCLAPFVPPDLEYRFEPVLTLDDLCAWLPLFLNTFGMSMDDRELIFDIFQRLSFVPDSEWRHYLIRVAGKVVATSSLHLGAGVAGLYNIATHPDYRQNGLGTAITQLTFEKAKTMGCTLGTLQTTYPNALRLYHRMGFEVYCKIGVYQCHWV